MKRYIHSAEEILAFSKNKIDVAADLEETTRPIIEHLMKLRLFSTNKSCNHWRKEISSFLNKVPRLKQNNKFPSKEFILMNTIDMNNDSVENCLTVILEDYSDLDIQPFDYDDLVNDIYSYFDWLSQELSTKGQVSMTSIQNKLKELSF